MWPDKDEASGTYGLVPMHGSGEETYANGVCQYDPECPVHRHRPGTTCPVVYRKRMAAAREAERRQQQRDELIGVVVFIAVVIIGFAILNRVIPGFLSTLLQGLGFMNK